MAGSLTLDQLMSELAGLNNKLKENSVPSSFWHGDELGDSKSLETKILLESASKSLQRLKDLHTALNSLRLTVDDKIREIEDSYIPPSRHNGISSLPDEIFLHIVDLVCSDVEKAKVRDVDIRKTGSMTSYARVTADQCIKQLSSVSRRFRAATINTTCPWSCLDSRDCLEDSDRFETRLARSRNAPLSLDLDLVEYTEWEQILSRTLPFKERWQILDADLSSNVKKILESFPSVEFPRLETACLTFAATDDHDAFFSEWSFPRIKVMQLYNAIPRPGLFRDLTAFRFVTREHRYEFDDIYPRLVDFLSQTHNLQDLLLDFSDFVDPSPETFTSLELTSVKKLSIFNYNSYLNNVEPFSAVTLRHMINSLQIPNVKDVCIGVHFQVEEDLNDWLFSDLLDSDLCRNVQSLFFSTAFRLSEESMLSFFVSFPNVEELEVDAVEFGSTLEHSDCQLDLNRLRTLFLPKIDEDVDFSWEHQLETFTSYPDAVELKSFDGYWDVLDADDGQLLNMLDSFEDV